jgi:hypothetical protein
MIIDMKTERCLLFRPTAQAEGIADGDGQARASTITAASYVHGSNLYLATAQDLDLAKGGKVDVSRATAPTDDGSAIDVGRLHERYFPLWEVETVEEEEGLQESGSQAVGFVITKLLGLRRKDNNQLVPREEWEL